MENEFDRFREVEAADQRCRLPGTAAVIRLDGRGFTALTKASGDFEKPFDIRFKDAMVATTQHLVDCGFRVDLAYTQSDEISLLLHRDDATFGRRIEKSLTVLAGEASAALSVALNRHAVFDARLLQLVTNADVVDYFRWRSADALRNALSAHAYWALRKHDDFSATQATRKLEGVTVSEKNEILFQRGINFNDVPNWQKRGIAVYWQDYEIEGVDPRSGETKIATRRRIITNEELPIGEDFRSFVHSFDMPLSGVAQPSE